MQKPLFAHVPYENRFDTKISPGVLVFLLPLKKMVDEPHGRSLNSRMASCKGTLPSPPFNPAGNYDAG